MPAAAVRMHPVVRGIGRVSAAVSGIAVVALFAAWLNGAIGSWVLGDAPPPSSAEVPLPTWTWLSLQPLGALGLLVVALIDAPRFLRDGEPADAAEGDHP